MTGESDPDTRKRSEAAVVESAMPSDISEWGSKQTRGAYAPGTRFVIGGREFDPAEADRILGDEPSRE